MSYLTLEDSLKMGQLCVYFSQLTKSPLFVKFMVSINERTKIDISLNTFQTQEHKILAAATGGRGMMKMGGGEI